MWLSLLVVALSVLSGCRSGEANGSTLRVMTMRATAFTRARQPTRAGTAAHEGVVAADPAVLPLGSRIRISRAGDYDGDYLVTDTGAAVKGRHIDIYLPSATEARQFGTRNVRVEVLELGSGKEDARAKDGVPGTHRRN